MRVDETLPLISVDAMQIQQVLINLIRNSLNAMQLADRLPYKLWLETTGNASEITIIIRDSGPGLGPLDPDLVFDALLENGGSSSEMALRISRSIIEAHGGHITASNAAGGGAEFRITLPVTQP